jgi:predicted GNAT family acetyltransferase
MPVVRYETPQQFKDAVFPFLLQKEAIHNIQLGVISNWLQFPDRYNEAYLASIQHNGDIVGTAMMTLPHPLQLSDMDPVHLDLVALIDDLYTAYPTISGVGGPVALTEAFVEAWAARTGQASRLDMMQGLYQLEKVTHPQGVPGHLRDATSADVPLLARWVQAFGTEALDETPLLDEATKAVERRISHPDAMLCVWEVNGQVVSMAGVSGPTQNGIRVNAVYTPPEHRGKGYASACVATLSQWMLDKGRRYCFLYTDLSNPTSNSIYKKMGYQHLCDMSMYRFEAVDSR